MPQTTPRVIILVILSVPKCPRASIILHYGCVYLQVWLSGPASWRKHEGLACLSEIPQATLPPERTFGSQNQTLLIRTGDITHQGTDATVNSRSTWIASSLPRLSQGQTQASPPRFNYDSYQGHHMNGSHSNILHRAIILSQKIKDSLLVTMQLKRPI